MKRPGLPVADFGVTAAWLSIPAALAMALCVPFFTGLRLALRPDPRF